MLARVASSVLLRHHWVKVVVGGGAFLAYDIDTGVARSARTCVNAAIVGFDYKFGPASRLAGV